MDKDIPEIQPDIETKVSDETPEQTAEAPLSLDDEIVEIKKLLEADPEDFQAQCRLGGGLAGPDGRVPRDVLRQPRDNPGDAEQTRRGNAAVSQGAVDQPAGCVSPLQSRPGAL